ncbi:AraC family transcriptional regulator [Nocardia cyriacigeorgica]|uniref:AraC family transcriptional regulator n=1 Tax=Nocardia cyriacigeorgica TaxID=135487 RepID=A0A5R8NGG0_9NOCA|nr:AraC family transcriptional regulator [Nocardia cyriacigeorgica]TLF74782.1 AraC family transcriptional regulator [Nocardia cyriacigeorgica]
MDPLSDVVAAMRIGEPHSGRVSHHAPFGWQFPAFDAAGFHVVLAGTCWFLPPAADPIALRPGDIVLLPGGCTHGLADDPATPLRPAATSLRRVNPRPSRPGTAPEPRPETVLLCGAYLLDRSRSHPMLADLPEVIHLPAPETRHTTVGAIIDLLDSELAADRPGHDAMLRSLLDVLLLHILRRWLDRQAGTGWSAALHDPAVAAALSAIHGSPGHGWTVAALAAHAGTSRAGLARRFTDLIGRPPIAYLTWWRMTLAARQLRDTDTPLTVIARDAGYASEFAFAHAFKNEFGQPPGRYRRKNRPVQPPDRNAGGRSTGSATRAVTPAVESES